MAKRQEDVRLSPEAVFDFDGTLVHLPHKWNLYGRATKRGLVSRLGSGDFIRGLEREGVAIGPIISRRPPLRMNVTRSSVGAAGLGRYFPDSNIVLAGSTESFSKARQSECYKARAVVTRARERVIGMIEDKPDKLGKLILDELLQIPETNEPIVLGVVPSRESHDRVDKLAQYAYDLKVEQLVGILPEETGVQNNAKIKKVVPLSVERHGALSDGMTGYTIANTGNTSNFVLRIAMLDSIEMRSGQQFGSLLQDYAI